MLKKILLLCGLLATLSQAVTIIDAESATLQSAINSASDGDTIYIPADTVKWTTPVTLNEKTICIIGAGIDKTIIRDSTTNASGNPAINITINVNHNVRVSGITFRYLRNAEGGEYLGAIHLHGGSRASRIDHCKFLNYNNRCLTVTNVFGVMDSCQLIVETGFETFQGLAVVGNDSTTSSDLGSGLAWFIEDNLFEYGDVYGNLGACDAYYGAKLVFRYNRVHNTYVLNHGYESLNGQGGTHQSCAKMEFLNNVFTLDDTHTYIASIIGFRGGTGMIANNIFNAHSTTQRIISFTQYNACPSVSLCTTDSCGVYPCNGQPGWLNADSSLPIFIYNNIRKNNDGTGNDTISGTVYDRGGTCPVVNNLIVKDRDYFDDSLPPWYVPYTYPHPLRYLRKHQSKTHTITDTAYNTNGVTCSVSTWKSKIYLERAPSLMGSWTVVDSMSGNPGKKDTLYYNGGITSFLRTRGVTIP